MGIDKIKAVHSKDIEECLANLGVLEDVKAGKVRIRGFKADA